jgi:hypothetical protein
LDSITFQKDFGNGFTFAAFYGKLESYWGDDPDGYPGNHLPVGTPPYKDNDSDMFGIQGTYQWDGGGVAFGAVYHRYMSNPRVESDRAISINPAFVQSFKGDWGEFAIHFEGEFGWAKTTISKLYWYLDPNINIDTTLDSTGVGLYLDGVWTYGDGAGDVTLASWYVSGTDWNNPDNNRPNHLFPTDERSLISLGDFAPFLVAHNKVIQGTGIFSNNFGGLAFERADLRYGCDDYECEGNNGLVNQWGIAILGNHKITPEIAVNYSIGYFRLVEPAVWWALYTALNGHTHYQAQSKELGWEIDLGFTFQLYEHLSFETQFGYMFNGDAYGIYEGAGLNEIGRWHDPKDTFAWANVVSFTF